MGYEEKMCFNEQVEQVSISVVGTLQYYKLFIEMHFYTLEELLKSSCFFFDLFVINID